MSITTPSTPARRVAVAGLALTALYVGVAWLTFSLPHLAFHLAHLEPFGLADAVGETASLSLTVVLAVVALRPSKPMER